MKDDFITHFAGNQAGILVKCPSYDVSDLGPAKRDIRHSLARRNMATALNPASV
jgi:hypothetical protein